MTISRRTFLGGLGAAAALAPLVRARRARAGGVTTRRVVIVGIGGGLRLRESLAMSEGATMPNLFGTTPLVSGFDPSPGAPRIAPEYAAAARPLALPPVRPAPLYTEGALVTNLRYAEGAPGHLQGHACLVSGLYNNLENRADARLPAPTIFEVHRRATDAPSTDAWYLSVPGGFYRALQASAAPGYGARYAGQYLQPPGLMTPIVPLAATGTRNLDVSGGVFELPTVPRAAAEDEAVRRLTGILDGNFPDYPDDGVHVRADEADRAAVHEHLAEIFADETYGGFFARSLGIGLQNGDGDLDATADALTTYHAEQILARFQPSILAMTLLDIDACHEDFNGYLRAQQLADACVAHLWGFIQATPGLRDETTLIVLPEHGRHLFMNGQNPDSYGRSGIDHGQGDDGDRDVWMLALGPDIQPGVIAPTGVTQSGRSSGRYETIDAVMTAMTLLGHGETLASELGAAGGRPGLVIQEVLR